MSQHYEREIKQAQEDVASVGQKAERTDPRSRAEIESFIRGFGVSAASVKRITDEWEADQARAREAGWESHADSVWYDA